jgi:hypothetical protein
MLGQSSMLASERDRLIVVKVSMGIFDNLNGIIDAYIGENLFAWFK